MEDSKVFVTYLYPIRFIVHENEEIDFSLDDINSLSYDHSLLHRIIGTITNTYDGKLVKYIVCGDGALGVRIEENIPKEDIVFHYNDLLCKLFLGGMNVEAVSNEDVVSGNIYKSKSIYPVQFGDSWNSHIHAELRMHLAGTTNAIFLFKPDNRTITLDKLSDIMKTGEKVVKTIPNLSTFHLLKGVTEYKYKNWSSSLSLLWIVAEEIVDYLWSEHVVDNVYGCNKKRRKEILNDSRTYTMAIKQEMLFQKGFLKEELYNNIFIARQARNKLIHEGKRISETDASMVHKFVMELLSDITK